MTVTVSESFPSLLAALLTGIFLFVIIVYKELGSFFGQPVPNFRNQKNIGVFPGTACPAWTFFIHTVSFCCAWQWRNTVPRTETVQSVNRLLNIKTSHSNKDFEIALRDVSFYLPVIRIMIIANAQNPTLTFYTPASCFTSLSIYQYLVNRK